MKTPNDQQLDNWLMQADQVLQTEPEHPISITDVQRRASQKLENRLARRKAVGSLAIAAALLGGWMILAPNPIEGPGRTKATIAGDIEGALIVSNSPRFQVNGVAFEQKGSLTGDVLRVMSGWVDFSDCVENWYILGLGKRADTVDAFWKRYVVNTPGG